MLLSAPTATAMQRILHGNTLHDLKRNLPVKANPKTVASLAAVALLSATVVLVSFWALGNVDQVAEARKHSYAVIDHADNLRSALKDAETGQRGYLLTGDPVFLEPYLALDAAQHGQAL